MRDDVIELPPIKSTFYTCYGKRMLDIVLSGLALLILSPVFIVISIFEIVYHRGPGESILFRQERVGHNEKTFMMYKFRTMHNDIDEQGNLLPDEQRLTKYGIFLRKTSLDELPELWNVFKGDMSLIGPRPLLVRYIPYYTPFEHKRHDVLPGITGYAQVHGRNYVSWEDKFKMDVAYTQTLSLKKDIGILIKTIQTVLRRENIETGSFIEKDGVVYRPLDVERSEKKVS